MAKEPPAGKIRKRMTTLQAVLHMRNCLFFWTAMKSTLLDSGFLPAAAAGNIFLRVSGLKMPGGIRMFTNI